MGKKRMRKRYEAPFKARVALAALKDDKTLSELASEFGVHSNLISQWKRRLTGEATFGSLFVRIYPQSQHGHFPRFKRTRSLPERLND